MKMNMIRKMISFISVSIDLNGYELHSKEK